MHHQGVLTPWLHALFSFPMHHQAAPFTLVHVSLLGFGIPVLTQCITVYYFLVSCVFACVFYKSHFGALLSFCSCSFFYPFSPQTSGVYRSLARLVLESKGKVQERGITQWFSFISSPLLCSTSSSLSTSCLKCSLPSLFRISLHFALFLLSC